MNSHFIRLVLSVLLIFNLAFAPLAQANPDCVSAFSKLQTEDFETGGENVFNRTLPSTLVSAVTWLTFAQLQRSLHGGGDIITDAFLLTVPLDIGLTLASHAISLSRSEFLKRLFSGRMFGEAYQFVTRAGANITMGVSAILLSWLVAGIPLTPGHCAAAAALCGVVYPTLQATKTSLHKTWPRSADLKARDRLTQLLPAQLENHWAQVLNRAQELGVDEKEAMAAQVSILNAQALSQPIENRVAATLLEKDASLKKWVLAASELQHQMVNLKTEDKTLEKKANNLQSLRSKIRHRLISRWSDESYHALALGGDFSIEESFILQKELDQHMSRGLFRTFVASFIDQSLSVGVAGGVFLYAVNQWAQTGETPWFLF